MTGGELAVALQQQGMRVRPKPGRIGYYAQCPAHRGRGMNLSIDAGDEGRWLLTCWSRECEFEQIRLALNLPMDAFQGWASADFKRRQQSYSSPPSLVATLRGVHVLNGPVAIKMARKGQLPRTSVTISVPSKSRHVTKKIAADMETLFGAAQSTGNADLPVAYSARWAGKRLGIDHGSVSRSVRSLTAHGSIEVVRELPVVGKRKLPLYRLPKGGAR
jgi:hypothetical protein